MRELMLLRCAGSVSDGLGHVMRATAIAEAARARGAQPTFAMVPDPVATAIPRLRGFDVMPLPEGLGAEEESALLASRAPRRSWIVLDGYALPDRVRPLTRAGLHVCLMDDTEAGCPAGTSARLWVRPGVGLEARSPRALCGGRFAPIRPEFRRARLSRSQRRVTGAPVIAVLSGGSDAAGALEVLLARLAEAASRVPHFEALAIVGPAAPVTRDVGRGAFPLEILRAPRDLPARLATASLAISAAGTTVLELLCLGVPPLMVAVVDNQQGVGARIAASGGGIDLGRLTSLSGDDLAAAILRAFEELPRLVRAGRALVDGGGARRIVARMARLSREAS